MLSQLQVETLGDESKIQIFYAFSPHAPLEEAHIETPLPFRSNEKGMEIFKKHFFGNRLSVTLGPLVYSHTYARLKGRHNFKEKPHVFDLRETGGSISIRPGENLTVSSIESVALDERHGALTFPRLKHANVGLVLSPSYIDPLWRGVLTFHIVNHGTRSIELKFGEKIGACHFYEVKETALPANGHPDFAAKSHHYANTWEKILEAPEPFPQGKALLPSKLHEQYKALQFFLNWSIQKVLGTVGVFALVGCISFIAVQWNSFRGLPDAVSSLQQNPVLTSETHQLDVLVPKGQTVGERTQTVSDTDELGVPEWVFAHATQTDPSVNVEARIQTGNDGRYEVKVIVNLEEPSTSDRSVNVTYITMRNK